jgi:polyisoprenoid-binding protein YceI
MDYHYDHSTSLTGVRRRKALWDEEESLGETVGDYDYNYYFDLPGDVIAGTNDPHRNAAAQPNYYPTNQERQVIAAAVMTRGNDQGQTKRGIFMTYRPFLTTTFILGLLLAAVAMAFGQTGASSQSVEVRGGVASFDANTNISAVTIHGKSTALQAHMLVHREADALTVESIDVVLPIKTLTTGMGLRDEHMRKYIFTTADGNVPDLKFSAQHATCPAPAQSRDLACQVSGNLQIRGVSRPFTMSIKVKEDGSRELHAKGDAVVKLSDFGIGAPSELGVKTLDEVKIHLDFMGKPTALTATARTEGGR